MYKNNKIQSWLGVIVLLLFMLFPTATQLSNVPLLLIMLMWLVLFKNENYYSNIISTPIIWVLVGIYSVILVGLIYTPATNEWYSIHLRKYARFIYAAILLCILMGNDNLQKKAINGFVYGMLFILTSTWMNIWFLLPWSVSQNIGWNQSHHVFGDYITQNVMMSFFCILALNCGVKKNGIIRWLWILVAVLSAVSVTNLSSGRTGFVVLVAALLTYIIIKNKGRMLLVAFIGLTVGFIAIYASSDILQNRFKQAFFEAKNSNVDKTTSIGHRIYNYKTTGKMILEEPILGHGTGAYHTEICKFLDEKSDCKVYGWHPHNQFLFLYSENGIFGVGLYIALIVLMYLTALRSKESTAQVLLATLTSVMLINSLINSPWWSSRESQFFSYMLAVCVAMALNNSKQTKS